MDGYQPTVRIDNDGMSKHTVHGIESSIKAYVKNANSCEVSKPGLVNCCKSENHEWKFAMPDGTTYTVTLEWPSHYEALAETVENKMDELAANVNRRKSSCQRLFNLLS